MTPSWRQLSKVAGLRVQEGGLLIRFPDGREQRVVVDDGGVDGSLLRIWSMVARAGDLASLDDPEGVAWTRNRETDLVGFKLDRRGRLFGEAWVPTEGLTAEEWSFYVQTLASACDRFEYLLTGRDSE